jgi:hypothetical protein
MTSDGARLLPAHVRGAALMSADDVLQFEALMSADDI